jgi:hypothetical protein
VFTAVYVDAHVLRSYREAWISGIWAWDCVVKDHVLVIPFVVALLGDNPMQSEFACHLGQGGKFFCRMCEVKGFDSASGECCLDQP